jgi:hypothetical protein
MMALLKSLSSLTCLPFWCWFVLVVFLIQVEIFLILDIITDFQLKPGHIRLCVCVCVCVRVRVHVHVYGAGDQTQGFAHARQAVCH